MCSLKPIFSPPSAHCKVLLVLAVALLAIELAGQSNPAEVVWTPRIEVASGPAHKGRWEMNESSFHYLDDPTVAINQKGVVAVAWTDNQRKDIFLQIYDPNGIPQLEQAVNVSNSPNIFSWLSRVVISDDDPIRVYVLWQEIIFSGGTHGGEIFFARSTDGGRSFHRPMNLSNDLAGSGKGRLTRSLWHNGSLDLILGPEASLYASWTDYEGNLWFCRSIDRGGRFSRPIRIAKRRRGGPARGPTLAVGPIGIVHIAWAVGDDPVADIHYARSVDEGETFSEPQYIYKSTGHCDAPKIAVDENGKIHLVFAESPDGPFRQYQIRYTTATEQRSVFQPPVSIAGLDGDRSASLNFPSMSLDGDGNPYLVWEFFHRTGYRSRGLGFSWSSDGGRTFKPPSFVPGSIDPEAGVNGGLQGLLMRKLAVSRTGAIALVNSTFKKDQKSQIWLHRGRLSKH